MISADKLKFDANGLIPAVVVDHYSKKVLTVAYMNRESLAVTMEKGLTCFYSRSRKELWLKGETSGNYQHVVAITADCDFDALVVEVVKDGPACHLGTDSCFNNLVWASDSLKEFSLDALYELIAGRKTDPQEGSYTTYLFNKGIDKILKKVGEESTEVIVGAKGGSKEETVFEIADLTYHVMVLMVEMGITPEEIFYPRRNLPRTRKTARYRQEGEAGNNEVKPRYSANNFVRAALANSHIRQVCSCLFGAVLSRSSSEYRGFTRFFLWEREDAGLSLFSALFREQLCQRHPCEQSRTTSTLLSVRAA